MTRIADNPLIGKWRIFEADLWDRDYLDLVEPAYISFADDGHGEIAFGALNAGLDCEYGASIIFFTWFGFDEMDEVMGSGNAELNDDDTIDIEFCFHLGDEAQLKARRW
jgi:hypothetical protein